MNESLEKVAKALEDLGAKYNIPMQELEPIAKLCGTAIAQSAIDAQGAEQAPAEPMDNGADELAGALGGRSC